MTESKVPTLLVEIDEEQEYVKLGRPKPVAPKKVKPLETDQQWSEGNE